MSHEVLENAMDAGGARAERDRVLHARDVVVRYRTKRRHEVLAVDRVELELFRGETLGLVGESGSGKSSLGRSIAQLPSPTSGSVDFGGQDLTALRIKDLRPVRRNVQMIFQDPISSLNPRRTALDIVADPLRLMGHPDPKGRALEVLAEVGVNEQMAARKPHELSGGQCQRISIARAFVQEPAVLICDEPVSALDVSVQAQVLNLLERMKRDYGLSMIFISHDLAVVSNISDRVAVLYQGRMCEVAPSEGLYAQPRHHYTKLLLDSVPNPDLDPEVPGERVAQPKSLVSPSGCRFATRCPAATQQCRDVVPQLVELAPGHQVACHYPLP